MSIDLIYAMGDDAFSNSFDVQFGAINLPGISDLSALLLRVQDVGIPGFNIEEYEVRYKTMMIMKPSGIINDVKEFSMTLRVDRNWAVYKALQLWQRQLVDPNTGTISPDNIVDNNRMDYMTIAPSNPGVAVTLPAGVGNWRMEGVYPRDIPEASFDYTSGDALALSITFSMLRMSTQDLFI